MNRTVLILVIICIALFFWWKNGGKLFGGSEQTETTPETPTTPTTPTEPASTMTQTQTNEKRYTFAQFKNLLKGYKFKTVLGSFEVADYINETDLNNHLRTRGLTRVKSIILE